MASTPSTFAASGEEVISRSIDLSLSASARRPACSDLLDFYEIEQTAEGIRNGDFKRIALQFPDELLHDSVLVYRLLKRRVNQDQELYVLADTSYGSCCVDEVAAQHVSADIVVHYGHACMSQTSRLPVAYVFGRKPIDVESCVDQIVDLVASKNKFPLSVTIRHDVAYSYRAGEIVKRLRERASPRDTQIVYHELSTRVDPSSIQAVNAQNGSGLGVEDDSHGKVAAEGSRVMVYIGEESLTLTNILMTHCSEEVFSYNPTTKTTRLESVSTNKLLMRRFAVVQKARDADVFGILVGTLGVASYLSVITYLRNLLSRARKKSYTISVGKLNPAKLSNFMEIECFVLAACPENSLMDSKEFFKPIVTPHELKVALQPEGTWLGNYVLDFDRLIAEDESDVASNGRSGSDEEDPDRPSFSLVTGKYRQARQFGVKGEQAKGDDNGSISALVHCTREGTMAKFSESAAATFLQSRTYRGLEARTGEDPPSILEQGRSGIARGYADDHPRDA